MGVEPYKTHGFRPTLVEWRLKQRMRKHEFIFVSDMGDMWGDWVPKEWIERVLKTLRWKPDASYFFLTKNPRRYREFRGLFTDNMVLGATIETNRVYNLSRAPTPKERFEEMSRMEWKHKAIVIEPILDFDSEFVSWIRKIQPETVHVGYDNYNCRLPEPRLSKTETLVEELRQFTQVETRGLRKAWFE